MPDDSISPASWEQVKNRSLDTVSVKDFGAVGDGVADDYASIQASLDYASASNVTITFPSGTYLTETTLELKSNIKLDLLHGATIKRGFSTSAGGSSLMSIDDYSENISIHGGILDGNGTVFTDESFDIISGIGIDGLCINGTTFLDVIDFHAIDFTDATNVIIRDCKFMGFWLKDVGRDFSEAIQLDPGYDTTAGYGFIHNVLVDGCYFGENPDNTDPNFGSYPAGVGNHSANVLGVDVKNIRIVNCVFDSLTYAGVVPYAWNGVVISNNNFESCAVGVYMNRGTLTNTVGTENCVISGNTFEGTVQNDIHIRNTNSGVGTWFNKNISITGNTSKGSAKFVICYSADGLTVSGNTYEGRPDFSSEFLTLPTDFSNSNKNILVSGNTASQLNVFAFGGLEISNLSIIGNTVFNMAGRCVHITGTGTKSNISVIDNTIIDCEGVDYISIDTVTSNGCNVSNNRMLVGPEAKSISGGSSILVTQNATSIYVLDNTNETSLIDKRVFVPYGIVKTFVSATPEAALTAGPGSMAINVTNGDLYTKSSGNGNTGWVAK